MSNIRSHLAEIVGSTISGTSAIAAVATWQLQIAWGVTIAAGLVGIISGLLTIRSLLKRDKRKH